MLRKMKLVAALALLAAVVGARADDRKPGEEPFNDVAFVQMAAMDGMHEVQLGQIAAAKATREEVKEFAKTLVADHTKANEKLKAVAKAANIPLPDKLDEKHQAHIDRFKDYKGENFDGDFLKHQVDDHQKAVALFTQASKDAKNAQVKDFASKTLPTLQQHLEMAKKLQK